MEGRKLLLRTYPIVTLETGEAAVGGSAESRKEPVIPRWLHTGQRSAVRQPGAPAPCWPGSSGRTPSLLSPSITWVNSRTRLRALLLLLLLLLG